MKRMSLIGAIGALTLALLAPASVSAGVPPRPFGAEIDVARCINVRGAHGFGKIVLRVTGWARNNVAGAPTPNYIYITTKLQEKINGAWVNLGTGHTTPVIYPDGHSGLFDEYLGASWQFTSAVHPPTRLTMTVEFFDDLPTGDVRLGKISGRTAAC